MLNAPDLSVSSEEMRVLGEAKGGAPITVSVPLRNLGAGPARRIEIALRFGAGGEDLELARTALAEAPPAGESVPIEITAPAPAGNVTLKIVVDPERTTGDSDWDNNEARALFQAAGDALKPTVEIVSPTSGASLEDPVVAIVAKAADDTAIARVDVRVDQGFWTRLGRPATDFEGKALLQPGPHLLTVRAMDTSGNTAESALNVTITAPAPTVEILEPAEGAKKVYAQNLRKIAGRKMYEMDHVVTSRWRPEAYNAGLNPNTKAGQDAITNIISGEAAGGLKRAQDIKDTIIHKGKEWMEAGNKIAQRGNATLGNQKIKEGMRQMGKEYERQVAKFLKAKGLDPARALPPRLRQGLEIFKKVQKGATVEQAKEMLKALTPKGGMPVTPETIAEDLGHFVEFMNKWGLKAN